MCGIAGIWRRDGHPVHEASLEAMNSLLTHRGPDAGVVLTEGEIGFAFRRLAVLDLSDQAAKPLESDDGAQVLLFNGELHNFLEIRRELESRGRLFRSSGDTEVVLQAFREWGPSCFERFNGMWALALWNRRERRLLLSRDRFGIKPLYYSQRGPRFAFASEAKALLGAFPEEREMDPGELFVFLSGGSPDNGGTRTFFNNVFGVRPATWMAFGRAGDSESDTYWRMGPERVEATVDRKDPEEQFRSLLTDSVRIRLRSDVPVGVCLSGGLDSSAVACLASRFHPGPLDCFSLRYPDHAGVDESKFAAQVGRSWDGFRIHWVTPRAEGMLPAMERIVWHHDGPMPLRGRLGLWEVFAAAARRVKVTLVGDGGDELLAGYSRFALPYALDLVRTRGWGCVRPGVLRDLWNPFLGSGYRPAHALREALLTLRRRRSLDREASLSVFGRDFRRDADTLPAHRYLHTWLRSDVERPFGSHLENALWLDFRFAGLPEILHAADALSMAFSLENRSPFLDHRLVEFCFGLPFHEKIRDGRTKSVLRRAMSGIVPEGVLARRDKKGMPLPYEAFFRANRRQLEELILEGTLTAEGVLRRPRLERLLWPLRHRWMPVTPGLLPLIWRCAAAEIWHWRFIRGGFGASGAGGIGPRGHADSTH